MYEVPQIHNYLIEDQVYIGWKIVKINRCKGT